MLKLTSGLLALALLTGCASLTEDECRSGNWREIGLRDGTNGRTADYVARHAKACEKTGVKPDVPLWEQGRQSGLPVYCTPERAYREGRDGRDLSPVCPASDLRGLSAANERGWQYHRLTSEIRDLRQEADEIENKIAVSPDEAQRRSLLTRLSSLNARIAMTQARRQMYDSF